MDKSSKSSLMTSGTPKLAQKPNFMLYLVPSEIPTMWNIGVLLHFLKKDQALHKKNTKNSMKISQKLTVLSNCHNKAPLSNMSNGDISRTCLPGSLQGCTTTKGTLNGAKTAVCPWSLISDPMPPSGGDRTLLHSRDMFPIETLIKNG